ncbi:MAG TPA: hypothetical protein VGC13_11100 [Longimicrobium sp.]|jgi:hypothetical protein|uniref:hypothetical protein n=1 Tax=Longimicrobium sp. TaxID=2029185 RepID=UPI002EDA82FA
MTAVLQQIASSALILLFGVQALKVWRRFGTVRRDRAALAWKVTAASFLTVGVYATLHALVSAASVAAGEKSWLYPLVSDWGLLANLGRCVASIASGLLLLALMVVSRRTAPRIAAAAPAVLLVAAVAGTLAIRPFPIASPHDFFTRLAVLNAVTAVMMMAALLAAVQNDAMDQLLWLALAAYAIKETLSVSLLAVIAFWGVAHVKPYFSALFWLQLAVGILMSVLAARRLHLAGGGRRVPALFERLHDLRRQAPGPTGRV